MKRCMFAVLVAVLCVEGRLSAEERELALLDSETRIEWRAQDYQRARSARSLEVASDAIAPEPSLGRSGRVSSESCSQECGSHGRYEDPVFDDAGPCGRDAAIDPPKVEITRIRPTREVFDSRQVVRGSVEGECLVEAGLFEDGRKVADIPIRTSAEYASFAFNVKARKDRDSEIRVYNTRGQRDVFDLADDEADSGLASFGRWLKIFD